MRPIYRSTHMSMLDRIVMNVVRVTLEVSLIANRMLPETMLPDAAFSGRDPSARQAFTFWDAARECRLDSMPSRRKVGIAWRQRPRAVQMVRQHDNRIDSERTP